eukprot:3947168-Pleurochrysis_carterae.AAC.1
MRPRVKHTLALTDGEARGGAKVGAGAQGRGFGARRRESRSECERELRQRYTPRKGKLTSPLRKEKTATMRRRDQSRHLP